MAFFSLFFCISTPACSNGIRSKRGNSRRKKKILENDPHELIWACVTWNLQEVKSLIDAGGDVDISTDRLYTPLFSAVQEQDVEIVDLLIKAGAEVMITCDSYTPLHWSVMGKGPYSCKIARLILTAKTPLPKPLKGPIVFLNNMNKIPNLKTLALINTLKNLQNFKKEEKRAIKDYLRRNVSFDKNILPFIDLYNETIMKLLLSQIPQEVVDFYKQVYLERMKKLISKKDGRYESVLDVAKDNRATKHVALFETILNVESFEELPFEIQIPIEKNISQSLGI